ncbi:MerR family transcriptional regulator [Paenibacillaceae bacterium]|nr:MerR family transcriptional regulator [Paenibacillaceae bacterium]
MAFYTAKQLADILSQDDARMNLRTVRYYTQLGIIPPLELVGNKRGYTEQHLAHFRAIMTLTKTGETLASIQERLKGLTNAEIQKIGEQMHLYQPDRLLEHETLQISEDVIITLSPKISAETKQRVIESVKSVLKRGE